MNAKEKTPQYIKMVETPIPKLILGLGLPTTISMLITNLYNMADTYFVSSLGNAQSGATSVVFGLMAIIQASGFMFGQGAGTVVSRRLGAGNKKEACDYASVGFFSALIAGILLLVFGLLFLNPLMRLLGSTDTILPYARTYGGCILCAAPAMLISCVFNNILRYEGKAMYSMYGLASGAILNIFLDFLTIRVLGLGVLGAGVATAFSQYVSCFVLSFMFKQCESKISFSFLKTGTQNILHVFGKIVAGGLPSMIRQGLGSISVMVLNNCCKPFGDEAIAAMGIVSRVINFLFSVGLGVGQGYQPVAGFCYGAKKYSRVRKGFFFTWGFGTLFLGTCAIIASFFSPEVIRFFRDDDIVVKIGAVAMRYQCISLLFLPFTVCNNMMFQSTGKSAQASILATFRSGIFFIPIVFLFSKLWGLWGIEISQAVADVIAALFCIPFTIRYFKELPEDKAFPD